MKTATARFLLLLFALAAPTLVRAQQAKGDVLAPNQYLEIKTLPLSHNPALLVRFLGHPEPLGEPPLVQWNAGVKVTDTSDKTLAEIHGLHFWHPPFRQEIIVVHEEPVILIGDTASLTALHYSSGYLADVGDWAGAKVELQPLNNGDFKIVVSASGSGYEDLPNVFEWDGVSSREDSQARGALLRQVLKEASDEVEDSPDELGNTYRWSMDCFRALHATAILGNRADALQLCARARQRIEAFPRKWVCNASQPDCNDRERKLELDTFDSGMRARNGSAHEQVSETPRK
jgi:hypothetical protein